MRCCYGDAAHPGARGASAHLRDLGLVLAAAAALRLAFFSGFVSGDDPAYAQLANVLLQGRYPDVAGLDVFATRPLLLGAIALSVALFGWNELAFVLPVLGASLTGVAAAYALGVLLADTRAGLFAALTVTLVPLDLVYATTMTNDIAASALAGAGAVLSVAVCRERRSLRHAKIAGFAGGLLIGLAAGVKLAAAVFGLPLFFILGTLWVRQAIERARVLAIASGWLVAHAGLALFFRVHGGSWVAHVAAEWEFNRTYMLPQYAETSAQALLSYPQWMFGVAPVAPINHPFFPFGLFFPLGLAALVASLRAHRRRVWFLAIWIGAVFLFLEFWPLQLTPRYAPIHRLPRFVHPLVLPFAVAIGVMLTEALRRTTRVRGAAALAWGTFAVTSLIGAHAASSRHRDVLLDQRAAATITSAYPGRVAADPELLNYLRFRRGFQNDERLTALAARNPSVPARTLVVAGGSRRVDLDPTYTAHYQPPSIPFDWVTLAELPGEPAPWRPVRGVVYLSGSRETRWSGPPDLSRACPADVEWERRDELDVGNEISERQHAYAIEGETWRGSRLLQLSNGDRWRDDGRAFRTSQRFELRRLEPRRQLCVVVLIDPRVERQESTWFAGTVRLAATTSPPESGEAWGVTVLIVPAAHVQGATLQLRQQFVSSATDINSFLIGAFQPVTPARSATDVMRPSVETTTLTY